MFRTLILAAAAALGLTSAAHAVTMTQTFDSSPVEYDFVFGAGTKTVDLVSYDVITSGGGNLSSGLALYDITGGGMTNVTASFTTGDLRSATGYGNFIRIGDSNNSVGGQVSLTDGDTLFSGLLFSNLYKAVLFDTNGDPEEFSVTLLAQVPLPAALPMLLAALGGFGLLRRRRRAAA